MDKETDKIEKAVRKAFMRFSALLFLLFSGVSISLAETDIVARITSSPVYANGILRGQLSGNNIHLQRADAPGLSFMDPAVVGFGIPAGGRMEVELTGGYKRNPAVPLDEKAILLVAGAPQQAIASKKAGYVIREGSNPNTFVITPTKPEGMVAEQLTALAPAAASDAIPQRGIKIVHIGRAFAFTNDGETGKASVRIFGPGDQLLHSGEAEVPFLTEPRPAIYLTNITDQKRNHNWQRIAPGKILGADGETLPLSFLLFDRNEGTGNRGLNGVGVISLEQVRALGIKIPAGLERFSAGLILADINGDGTLDPRVDALLGGVSQTAPDGAKGHFPTSPLVGGKAYLSRPTGEVDKKAGERPGGSIMDVVYVAGDKPGLYQVTFTLFADFTNPARGDGASATYSVVVE